MNMIIKAAIELAKQGNAALAQRLIRAFPKTQKCKFCKNQATVRAIWADGRAYVPVCDKHKDKGKAMDDFVKFVEISPS